MRTIMIIIVVLILALVAGVVVALAGYPAEYPIPEDSPFFSSGLYGYDFGYMYGPNPDEELSWWKVYCEWENLPWLTSPRGSEYRWNTAENKFVPLLPDIHTACKYMDEGKRPWSFIPLTINRFITNSNVEEIPLPYP